MNIGVHVSFSIFVSSGYMPWSGIAGSYGGFIPSFLSNLYTVFYSGRISLHCHQQCKSVPFSLHLFQHLLFVDFLAEKAMAPHSSTLAWKIPWTGGAWWAAVHGVAKSRTRLSDFTFTLHFHALEKEMATHSSILALRIPGMGKPSGLLSMGSHRVRHN